MTLGFHPEKLPIIYRLGKLKYHFYYLNLNLNLYLLEDVVQFYAKHNWLLD